MSEEQIIYLLLGLPVYFFVWRAMPPHASRKWLLITAGSLSAGMVNHYVVFRRYQHDPGPIADIAGVLTLILFVIWVAANILFVLSWRKPKAEALEINSPWKLPDERFFTVSARPPEPDDQTDSGSSPGEGHEGKDNQKRSG